jgi:hypothetical protein
MNKKIILLVLTFCLMMGCTGIASARHINFENHTDFHWVGLYISEDGYGRSWSENLLSDRVNRGGAVNVNVHGTNRKYYKIKIIERKHGEEWKVIWHDVDLQDAHRVKMFYDHESGNSSYRVIRD